MKVSIKHSKTHMSEHQLDVLRKFLKFLQEKLPLTKPVLLTLTDSHKETGTTGLRAPKSKIYVLVKGRLLIDVLRTLSHEWVHEYQHQKMGLEDKAKIQNIGGPEENMANILAGIFIKQFDKKHPNFRGIIYGEKDSLSESLLNELSPSSTGVQEVINFVSQKPEILKELGFRDIEVFRRYIDGVGYEEFQELKNDIQDFLKEREKHFEKEMDEIERAVQDLSRDGSVELSVDQVIDAFKNGNEIILDQDIWSKLENTESNQIKKGDINKVKELAKKYNKTNPEVLKKALKSDDYPRPMILKYGNRYHLVAGNTRLCTAAAYGIKPKVLIGEV